MTELNIPVLREWVKTLRSGEYTQADGKLRKELTRMSDKEPSYAYCCLGVLCDMAEQEGMGSWVYNDLGDWEFAPEVGVPKTTFLPVRIQEWAGLPSNAGFAKSEPGDLSWLNDGYVAKGRQSNESRRSFAEIAAYIEARIDAYEASR